MERPTRDSFRRPTQDEAEQSSDPGSRASSTCNRSLETALERLFARGSNVPNVRTGGKEGAVGAALGEELPPLAHPSNRRSLGIPDRLVTFQVMRRTLETDMQQHGTLKDTQDMLRHASYQDHGRRLRSEDQTERSRGSQLAHVSGARRLEGA